MKEVTRFILIILIVLLAQLASVQLTYSISLKEILSKYSFSTVTPQINVTGYKDYMADKNNNGINDTLIFELETNNTGGLFIFVISLSDKGSILLNETNKTLNKGMNKLNLSINSAFLSQSEFNKFNYSIKIYNSSYSLKYSKDRILTQQYSNYEQGFSILNIKDLKANKSLRLNITVNSSIDGTFEAVLFLSYNNSIISFKDNKSIASATQVLAFDINNETIKRTHYIGRYNLSLKIGKKLHRANFSTAFYDFRDFADTPYIFGFADGGNDIDNNNKYDALQINATIMVTGEKAAEENKEGNYTLELALYDESDKIAEIKSISALLAAGKNTIPISFNGTMIYSKKLNGPFNIKYAGLFWNGSLIDKINGANGAYTTGNYNFNDFESPSLPDLSVNISVSDGYLYGINNVTINFTFRNTGSKPAFNIFYEIFDNYTFFKINKSNILNADGNLLYQINFTNISDLDITAAIDLLGFIEELNESNNADKITIKLNKKPVLNPVNDIIANETDKIIINASAFDPNNDKLSLSINLTKFLNNSNIFQWDTATTDSGNYTLSITASDGYLNDSAIFKLIILDMPERDIDNDGISDTIDKIIGNEKSINTSTINLTIFLDGSSNLSKFFNKTAKVKIMEQNFSILEFDIDLSLYKLNLTNVTIDRQLGNSTGSLLVSGLRMPENSTKTLHLDNINNRLNGICIKDEEISEIGEISGNCNSNNEFKVECDGTLQHSYACAYNSTLNKYKIQGLRHSGIVQIPYTKPPSTSDTASIITSGSTAAGYGSSSGGGGGIICASSWKCNEWSECINGFKNRECYDTNQCAFETAFETNKPIEKQQCIANELRGKKEESLSNGNIVRVIVPISFNNEDKNENTSELITRDSTSLVGITGQFMKHTLKTKASLYTATIFFLLLFIMILYFATNTFINKI